MPLTKHLKNIYDKWSDFFHETDLSAVKLILAVGSILWGLQLLFPGNSFDRPMFSVVRGIMPEMLFGFLFLLQGLLSIYFDFYKSCTRMRVALAAISSLLWSGITIGMVLPSVIMNQMGNFSMPVATSPAIVLTIASLWVLIRCPAYKKGGAK